MTNGPPPAAASSSLQQNARPFTGNDTNPRTVDRLQAWQDPLNPPHAAGTQLYPAYPYMPYQPQQPESQPQSQVQSKPQRSSPSPSPLPAQYLQHWDEVLRSFLTSLGLTQALHGFEADMLVLNSAWEKSKVPGALDMLVKDLMQVGQSKGGDDSQEPSLDDRKLNYVHLAHGAAPRSQTSVNKSISAFLAQNRARNDASNRDEFLHSSTQKRRRLAEVDSDSNGTLPSCARTDAKPVDRDVQMKYDIAKNEEGPLRRTVKSESMISTNKKGKQKSQSQGSKKQNTNLASDAGTTPMSHPGLDERLQNIETHLSVRYVPSTPGTLLARLKLLEDHIVRLEKDYPPWAALHFNQPNRGWPPPPRPTPIIVPPHLRTVQENPMPSPAFPAPANHDPPLAPAAPESRPSGSRPRHNTSSLHRAVMERLEVQKAMSDLAGGS